MFIKARQDDYWHKIAVYNYKIHQLEKQENLAKKQRDQANLRKLLKEQIHHYHRNRTLEVENDRRFMTDVNKRNEVAHAEELEALKEKRRTLQDINKERSEQQQHLIDQWKNDRKQLYDY